VEMWVSDEVPRQNSGWICVRRSMENRLIRVN
jgi:hypothetical protein